MELAGILRVVALCLITFGLHGPTAVRCSSNLEERLSAEPSSLKDILDFLGRLNGSGLKTQVLENVETKVKEYLEANDIPGTGIKENLEKVLIKVSELRKDVLKTDESGANSIQSSDESVEEYATTLINWLPIFHSEMWFLFFHLSTDCADIGGYKWLNGGTRNTPSISLLQKWLTSDSKDSGFPIVPKGFSVEGINQNIVGIKLASKTGIELHQGGPLNHAQYGLMFLRQKWNASNLASAVLFLEEFCREVKETKFSTQISDAKYAELPSLCQKVTEGLKPLTDNLWPLYSPISVNDVDSEDTEVVKKVEDAVHKNMYKEKLKTDALSKYVGWLINNIPGIIESLTEMTTSSWNTEEMSNSAMSGPFKYGFVFKTKWDETGLYVNLKNVPTDLSSALNKLLEYLTPKPATSEAPQGAKGEDAAPVQPTAEVGGSTSTEEKNEKDNTREEARAQGSGESEPTSSNSAAGSLPTDKSVSGPSSGTEEAPAAGPLVTPETVVPGPGGDQNSEISQTEPKGSAESLNPTRPGAPDASVEGQTTVTEESRPDPLPPQTTSNDPVPPQPEASESPRENQGEAAEELPAARPQAKDTSNDATPSQPGTSDSPEQVAPGSEHGTSGPQSEPSSEGTTENSDEHSTEQPSSPAPATNLRPAPEASASVPKEPSSFATPQSIGCMVTLGLLVSII